MLLKGGTAINLTVFNLPRLSVDIDMDYIPNDSREDMLMARERISRIIKDYMGLEGYQLSPASRFSHSLDAFHFQYLNTGGNRDMIKIEINYSLRAHIFDPVEKNILPKALDDGLMIRMINPNFDVSAIDTLNFAKIRRDLFPVISKKDNFNLEERKTQAKEYISNLMCLTESEREYMERFCAKEYRPELLFDEDSIIERIEAHPMALWKCR